MLWWNVSRCCYSAGLVELEFVVTGRKESDTAGRGLNYYSRDVRIGEW